MIKESSLFIVLIRENVPLAESTFTGKMDEVPFGAVRLNFSVVLDATKTVDFNGGPVTGCKSVCSCKNKGGIAESLRLRPCCWDRRRFFAPSPGNHHLDKYHFIFNHTIQKGLI